MRERLALGHVKSRLLGHFGTTSGQNFIYVHLNRLIKERGLSMIYISGPGHGGPALVAQVYLEGTYTEYYPEITQDIEVSTIRTTGSKRRWIGYGETSCHTKKPRARSDILLLTIVGHGQALQTI